MFNSTKEIQGVYVKQLRLRMALKPMSEVIATKKPLIQPRPALESEASRKDILAERLPEGWPGGEGSAQDSDVHSPSAGMSLLGV